MCLNSFSALNPRVQLIVLLLCHVACSSSAHFHTHPHPHPGLSKWPNYDRNPTLLSQKLATQPLSRRMSHKTFTPTESPHEEGDPHNTHDGHDESEAEELEEQINEFLEVMGPGLFIVPATLVMLPFALPALPLALLYNYLYPEGILGGEHETAPTMSGMVHDGPGMQMEG